MEVSEALIPLDRNEVVGLMCSGLDSMKKNEWMDGVHCIILDLEKVETTDFKVCAAP